MVILAVGLEPREDAEELGEILGISRTDDGWFREFNNVGDPVATNTSGITIAGTCQGPKDIPDAVAQGAAAAANVLQSTLKGSIEKSKKYLSLKEIENQARKLSTIMEE
jgi:heterodisulfide reductase subunit A